MPDPDHVVGTLCVGGWGWGKTRGNEIIYYYVMSINVVFTFSHAKYIYYTCGFTLCMPVCVYVCAHSSSCVCAIVLSPKSHTIVSVQTISSLIFYCLQVYPLWLVSSPTKLE